MSGTRVQLQQRHWRIYSPDGLHIVKGDGVLGQVQSSILIYNY